MSDNQSEERTVYIVRYFDDITKTDSIEGLFSTLEKANAFINTHPDFIKMWMYVLPYGVDTV